MKKGKLRDSGKDVAPLEQRILAIFREHDGAVVSGGEFSSLLAVSRTAIWKHINSLKAIGYEIDALPSQGYRLLGSPDKLIPAEIARGLSSARVGKRIVSFAETVSTNLVAFKMAEDGAEDGTVVLAESQSRGKGRLGREWLSPAGVNLYCSVILRPAILPVAAYQLTFLSAVAVARAIEQTTALAPRIKWPNDILVNGRKVAGLLNEMSAETDKVNFVVLGIGVNLNMRHDQLPDDLRHPASSLLLEGGVEIGRICFIRNLLGELDLLYDLYLKKGEKPIREEWLVRCDILGRTVRVSCRDYDVTGTVSGVDDDGALLVRLPSGVEEKVLTGDVSLL